MRSKEALTLPIGTVQTIKVEGIVNTTSGQSTLTFYFSEQIGFAKLVYHNLDGSQIIMTIDKIK